MKLLLWPLCICGYLVTGAVAQASWQAPSLQRHAAGLQAQARALETRVEGAGRMRPLRQVTDRGAAAPIHQAATSLALPAQAFSPATLVSRDSGVESNAAADAGPFATNHATSYSSLGRVTGYYQHAQWQPPNTAATVDVRYMGSIFSGPDTAHAGWQDGMTHTQTLSGIAPTDCTSQAKITCSYGVYLTKQSTAVLYFALQFNQCLIELSVEGTQAVLTAQANRLITAGATLQADAEGAAEAACSTPAGTSSGTGSSAAPDFDLLSVSVRSHTNVDDAARPAIKRSRLGKKVYLYAYYTIQSAPTPTPVSITFRVMRNGKIVAARTYPETLDMPPPNQYYKDTGYKPRQIGIYRVAVRLTVGGQVRTGQTTFRVVTE